jgi:hypothetical protein
MLPAKRGRLPRCERTSRQRLSPHPKPTHWPSAPASQWRVPELPLGAHHVSVASESLGHLRPDRAISQVAATPEPRPHRLAFHIGRVARPMETPTEPSSVSQERSRTGNMRGGASCAQLRMTVTGHPWIFLGGRA